MSRVLYCLVSCIHDHMLGYIRDPKMPKEVRGNLKKIFTINTTARKLQLSQELNNVQQKDMSITSYTLMLKELPYSLGSINANVDMDEMVQICIEGRTTVQHHENYHPSMRNPSFLLRPSINVVGRRKPRLNKERCLGRAHALFTL